MTNNQKRIEGMFQRAMDLRDSSPGWLPDKLENSYAKRYRQCFRSGDSYAVAEFKVVTRAYRRELRKGAKEETAP